jgi:Tfp pilus assembly protein PilO
MKIKKIIITALPLAIAVVLFILVGSFGISEISGEMSAIKSAENDQNVLTQKLNLLQTLSQTVAEGSSSVTFALPDTNPTLTALSQLKLLAGTNGVILSKISSRGGTVDSFGLNEVPISFNVNGTEPQIVSFLTSTAGIAPIVILDKINSTQKDTGMEAIINARLFWSPLPQTIPSLTQPVTDLTDAEKETLAKVTGLTQPVSMNTFQEATTSSGTNPNPFGQ